MGNTSLGILALSLSLWAADLGAGHYGGVSRSPPATLTHQTPCSAGVEAATDDSDLEVVVCGKPWR